MCRWCHASISSVHNVRGVFSSKTVSERLFLDNEECNCTNKGIMPNKRL